MCVSDVLAGGVEQCFVVPEDTGCWERLHDGAATPGDDGIYMIQGVGEVCAGAVQRGIVMPEVFVDETWVFAMSP